MFTQIWCFKSPIILFHLNPWWLHRIFSAEIVLELDTCVHKLCSLEVFSLKWRIYDINQIKSIILKPNRSLPRINLVIATPNIHNHPSTITVVNAQVQQLPDTKYDIYSGPFVQINCFYQAQRAQIWTIWFSHWYILIVLDELNAVI